MLKYTEEQGSIRARESCKLAPPPPRQPRLLLCSGHKHWRAAADQVQTCAGPLGLSHSTERETEAQRYRTTCSQVLSQDQSPWGDSLLNPAEASTGGEAQPHLTMATVTTPSFTRPALRPFLGHGDTRMTLPWPPEPQPDQDPPGSGPKPGTGGCSAGASPPGREGP